MSDDNAPVRDNSVNISFHVGDDTTIKVKKLARNTTLIEIGEYPAHVGFFVNAKNAARFIFALQELGIVADTDMGKDANSY